MAPEIFHGDQVVGQPLEAANHAGGQNEFAQFAGADHGDGAGHGVDLGGKAVEDAVGDFQQAGAERGVIAYDAADIDHFIDF